MALCVSSLVPVMFLIAYNTRRKWRGRAWSRSEGMVTHRIVGNVRWSKLLRKSRFLSRRNFYSFLVFVFSTSYWPCPFIVAGLTKDKRSPVEEGRMSAVGLKYQYSAIARLSKTSAQNARVIPQVQLATQNVFNFFTVLIFVFWSWVTKITKC